MGYTDAVRDNVRREINGAGADWYYPKCHKCGAEVPSWNYRSGIEYTCKRCKLEDKLVIADKRNAENVEARMARLEKAIERIKAHGDIRRYTRAIKTVSGMIETGDHVFDSTEEVMVALILSKNDIQFRHQVRFGKRYVADFVMDEMKVVLEVDGDIFHGENRKSKQKVRDDLIIAALGPEWEIIRIKTSVLNKNISRLPKALKAVLKRRELYRRNNNGQLPEWYNDEG